MSLAWVGIVFPALALYGLRSSSIFMSLCRSTPRPVHAPSAGEPCGGHRICSLLPEGLWGPWRWHQEAASGLALCMVLLKVLKKPVAFSATRGWRNCAPCKGALRHRAGWCSLRACSGWAHLLFLFANAINRVVAIWHFHCSFHGRLCPVREVGVQGAFECSLFNMRWYFCQHYAILG